MVGWALGPALARVDGLIVVARANIPFSAEVCSRRCRVSGVPRGGHCLGDGEILHVDGVQKSGGLLKGAAAVAKIVKCYYPFARALFEGVHWVKQTEVAEQTGVVCIGGCIGDKDCWEGREDWGWMGGGVGWWGGRNFRGWFWGRGFGILE